MIIHKSVLLEESIAGLNIQEGSIVVDATLGGGVHSNRILSLVGVTGKLIVIDQDVRAIEDFKKQLTEKENRVYLVQDNFSHLKNILQELKIEAVDAILADLGYSSIQLEDEEMGMSFLLDAPLDMRLDREGKITARDIVNNYSQGEIGRILKDYGEERFASMIAKKIADRRKVKPIETTGELVEIVKTAMPERYQHGKLHPATKTFQALRIETNRELSVLEEFIPQAIELLQTGGRLAVISFHSLEDRIVKNILRKNARGCICPADFPICQCGEMAKVKIITKKPIIPGEIETQTNSRARSAKLRICEKL
ncbi:MAG: 16S rRNA (cytosine(1402)-N(4))-methyltransferase RsmH [Parcubacteria group bacterium]|jgi:16S rRNA (cytosine1402-N4)-methyltransferase